MVFIPGNKFFACLFRRILQHHRCELNFWSLVCCLHTSQNSRISQHSNKSADSREHNSKEKISLHDVTVKSQSSSGTAIVILADIYMTLEVYGCRLLFSTFNPLFLFLFDLHILLTTMISDTFYSAQLYDYILSIFYHILHQFQYKYVCF